MIISKDDLAQRIDTLVVTCLDTGKYDIDITLYTCTKPCPIPKVDQPTIMMNDKNKTDFFTEYNETVK